MHTSSGRNAQENLYLELNLVALQGPTGLKLRSTYDVCGWRAGVTGALCSLSCAQPFFFFFAALFPCSAAAQLSPSVALSQSR